MLLSQKSSNMNTTVNGSSCPNSPWNPPAAQTKGETFAYCLISVVSLVGNSFIGIIVYKTQTLRKPINYFIVNMATSDLLYPIFLFPKELTEVHADYGRLISGPLGQALCKLVPFLVRVSMFVSIQSLILTAVDRFGAVVFPLRSPLISSKLCPFFIAATWIVAMAVLSPLLFVLTLVEDADGKQYCFVTEWNEVFGPSSSFANYNLALIVVFFYIPIVLLVVLYSVIVIKLKTQKIPGEQSVGAEQQRAKRNRSVLKMAIAVVVGFTLCWLPKTIILLLSLFPRWNVSCAFSLYAYIAHFMSLSNCAINPCICFIFSGNYRQGLKRLLKCFNPVQDRVN